MVWFSESNKTRNPRIQGLKVWGSWHTSAVRGWETSTYEPTTPEVLRKLSKVVAEGGELPSSSSAASRLAVWAAQAQAKVPLAAELSKQDHHKYKFGKEKAAEAAQAIATLREALSRTKKPARGQGKIHVEIIFIDTVPTAKPLAARIHHFYGKHGPKVKVQLREEADGCTWSKQRDTVNYATTTGDERSQLRESSPSVDSVARSDR